jgi:hypothetical protein
MKSKTLTLLHEPEYPKLEEVGNGILYLTDRKLIFCQQDNNSQISYPFENIRGKSTERNNIFQLVLEDDIARFEMHSESCYKWEVVYDYIRRRGGYLEEE